VERVMFSILHQHLKANLKQNLMAWRWVSSYAIWSRYAFIRGHCQ